MTYHRKRKSVDPEREAMLDGYFDFLRRLPAGKSYVYHTGAFASNDWCAVARRAHDAGLGALVQRRKATPKGSVFEYIFQRNRNP